MVAVAEPSNPLPPATPCQQPRPLPPRPRAGHIRPMSSKPQRTSMPAPATGFAEAPQAAFDISAEVPQHLAMFVPHRPERP